MVGWLTMSACVGQRTSGEASGWVWWSSSRTDWNHGMLHASCMRHASSLVAMAARATRSASRKARVAEAVATGPLGALSHDELGVIFDGLADPLQPVVAVALSSTCLGLRTPLRAALEVLKERHERAKALCRTLKTSCAGLRDVEVLQFEDRGITTDDLATLGMLLNKWLPRLQGIWLHRNHFGDAGMHALCAGLGHGAAPSLCMLTLEDNWFGPTGAKALAAALRRGAMPKLNGLNLDDNHIGNQGIAALAAPLRKLPLLEELTLSGCRIGDDALLDHGLPAVLADVALNSLVGNLGKDDFKALKTLWLNYNKMTDAGLSRIASAIKGGAMPKLGCVDVDSNDASKEAKDDVYDALYKERPAKRRANES